MKYEQADR